MQKGSVAILCGGGPAPGINTVVATIAKRFMSDGYRVIGLNYGYKTMFTDEPKFIDDEDRPFGLPLRAQHTIFLRNHAVRPKITQQRIGDPTQAFCPGFDGWNGVGGDAQDLGI